MLRERDYLLTLAAVWLLLAALSSSSGQKFVIRASATEQQQQQQQQQQQPQQDGHSYFSGERPASSGEQPLQVDMLMSKIRRNLDQSRRPSSANSSQPARLKPDGHEPRAPVSVHNSYSHYADATGQQQQQTGAKRPPAKHDSFREAKEVRVDQLRSASRRPANALEPNATSSLFLLSHHQILPPQAGNRLDDADELGRSEQQQQPPFTMFAPGNQNPADQQQNIRQILSNYQRYPQARQLTDQQRPPELHLRAPAPQAPAFNLGGSGQPQQQPLSPLQLLAGPFQAFLPALAGQQQQPQLGQPGQSVGAQSPSPTPAPNVATLQPPQQPPAPLSGLLNAFNLAAGQQQQPGAPRQPGGLPSLQDFYQQLPLYQALMAARQRQEAFQAAQRLRQQQQQQQQQQPSAGNPGLGFNLNPLVSPPGQSNGGNAPPLPIAPPFAAGLPPTAGFGPMQQANPGQWPQAGGDLGLRPPVAQQPPVGQPQPPATSNQNGPVQFDDDQQQQNNQPAGGGQQQDGGTDKHDNGGRQQQQQQGGANNGDESGDQNQNEEGPQQQPGNEQDQNGQQQGGKAEEEDPDLKSFQNLANGGDSFTDLFPPGILSNNDISEIKTQQAEQAKKQETEERQRQQQQQQQQQQQPQPQQQAHNNQPMNQFTGANGQGQQDGQDKPADSNQAQGQSDEGGNDDQDEGGPQQDEEGGGDGQDSPSAAALTAKPSSASETLNGRAKLAKSPGVEYAAAKQ